MPPPADLPAWPVLVLFVGFPVWWLLGLGAFAPFLAAVPMVCLLVVRGSVALPKVFVLWVLFLAFVCTSVVMLDGALRLVGFGLRLSNYLAATVLFLYVFNAGPRRLPLRAVVLSLTAFFAFVVVGGWLGVLFPGVRVDTPTYAVLPSALLDNDYVRALVRPSFAEVQQPYGSPRSFVRPSAPFAYTNGWGCNTSLLVPCVLAALSQARRRATRVLLALLLAAAAVPAAATLNRGMFVALGFGVLYGSVRLALRGRPAALVATGLVGAAGALAGQLTGTFDGLQERLYYSGTNVGRSTIYREAFEGTLESPLLGHGAPRPSALLNISIGTQGQVWNVMFSYGFPALAVFVGWFAVAAWLSRRASAPGEVWLHTVLVVGLLTFVYYGYDGPQLGVLMTVAAVLLRGRGEAAPGADGSEGRSRAPGAQHVRGLSVA